MIGQALSGALSGAAIALLASGVTGRGRGLGCVVMALLAACAGVVLIALIPVIMALRGML